VKGVVASHDTLIHLFERMNFFLQRLKSYTGIPLTDEMTDFIGKIMALLISILALSTKAMTEGRSSLLIHSLSPLLADYSLEKFLKGLMGKKDIEDALLRLDSLTNEEGLMTVARNLEVAHRVDIVVRDVDGNVEKTKELTKDVGDNVKVVGMEVKVIEGVVQNIDHNVKATKTGT
jgi:hypothetical protein